MKFVLPVWRQVAIQLYFEYFASSFSSTASAASISSITSADAAAGKVSIVKAQTAAVPNRSASEDLFSDEKGRVKLAP